MPFSNDFLPKSLANLNHGDRALVVGIAPEDVKLGAKLAARGLVPGVEIGVVRAGDPLLLAVDDARWAINRDDANQVQVDVLDRRRSLLHRLLRR